MLLNDMQKLNDIDGKINELIGQLDTLIQDRLEIAKRDRADARSNNSANTKKKKSLASIDFDTIDLSLD